MSVTWHEVVVNMVLLCSNIYTNLAVAACDCTELK